MRPCRPSHKDLSRETITKERDMKTNYFISLIMALLLIGGIIVVTGAGPLAYLDIPSLIVVTLLPAIMIIASFSFEEIGRSFSAALDPNADQADLRKAHAFFGALGKYVNLAAGIGIVAGIIAIASNLSSYESAGLGISLALLVVFYSMILQLIFVIPFHTAIKKNLEH
jgi:flagellar motor component MotA